MKRWSVKEESWSGNTAAVNEAHTLPVAILLLVFSFAWIWCRVSIVDHDEEMRRWGCYDWVNYKTAQDRVKAAEVRKHVIPVIRPGESISIPITFYPTGPATADITEGRDLPTGQLAPAGPDTSSSKASPNEEADAT